LPALLVKKAMGKEIHLGDWAGFFPAFFVIIYHA
jgi:hypothetical protein